MKIVRCKVLVGDDSESLRFSFGVVTTLPSWDLFSTLTLAWLDPRSLSARHGMALLSIVIFTLILDAILAAVCCASRSTSWIEWLNPVRACECKTHLTATRVVVTVFCTARQGLEKRGGGCLPYVRQSRGDNCRQALTACID